MGSSRTAGSRLLGFLGDAATLGVDQALRSLDLGRLVGQPPVEMFIGLADYICPEGGDDDKAIARNSYMQTLDDIAEAGITDLDNLGNAEFITIFETFVTYTIENRILNDIGTRAITLPTDVNAVNSIQGQLHDFIANGVHDAMATAGGTLPDLLGAQMPDFVDTLYENAFRLLAAMGEAEASQ